MTEVWKTIPGFGRYSISNLGRVKSKRRIERLMCPSINNVGYRSVNLCKNGIKTTFRVHRLVAEVFISNIGNKPTVNHKNGVKTDNRVDNLEWATHSEQNIHAVKLGLKKSYGEHHSQHKLIEYQVIEIRNRILSGEHPSGQEYGVSNQTIKDIRDKRSWTHI